MRAWIKWHSSTPSDVSPPPHPLSTALSLQAKRFLLPLRQRPCLQLGSSIGKSPHGLYSCWKSPLKEVCPAEPQRTRRRAPLRRALGLSKSPGPPGPSGGSAPGLQGLQQTQPGALRRPSPHEAQPSRGSALLRGKDPCIFTKLYFDSSLTALCGGMKTTRQTVCRLFPKQPHHQVKHSPWLEKLFSGS